MRNMSICQHNVPKYLCNSTMELQHAKPKPDRCFKDQLIQGVYSAHENK